MLPSFRTRLLAGAASLTALALLLASTNFGGSGSAEAARPARGSISVPDGVYAGTTMATVSEGALTASADGNWVSAKCYQDQVLVYGQMAKLNAAGQATLTLGPTQLWTGGGADCTAEAGYFTKTLRWRVTASTTFNVAP